MRYKTGTYKTGKILNNRKVKIEMLQFFVGLLFGAAFGVMVMAIFAVASRADDMEELYRAMDKNKIHNRGKHE